MGDSMRGERINAAGASLRERYEADIRLTKINQLKVTNQWRKIMRAAKNEQLKNDIHIIAQNHERNVDRKDACLQMLLVDMHDAEDQILAATRSHLKNVDAVLVVNDKALKQMERAYQEHLQLVDKDFQSEMQQLTERFNAERDELLKIVNSIDQEEDVKREEVCK